MKHKDIEDKYYIVPLIECQSRVRDGQVLWLDGEGISASCVKLHPRILPIIDEIVTLSGDGKKFTANWVEVIDSKGEVITVPSSYLKVLFSFTKIS